MRRHHALPLVAMILAINGCSLFQPEGRAPSDSQTESETECDWTPKRGIAELVRFEDSTAIMDFFPGEIRFRAELENRDWTPGDEFKVLLETSERPECGAPRVRELSPVGPDA